MKEAPRLSVVVPLYNEEACVMLLYDSLARVCDRLNIPYELIFVDDGSQDRTFLQLERLHWGDPRVKVIRFRRNFGQTPAMVAGFEYAGGDIVVSMDGDLQNDPADIPKLLAKIGEGFDIVCGWRKNRQDKFWTRRVPSIVANWIIGLVTGVKIRDNGCSLKAYRASVIKNVALYSEMHRFIPAMATLTGAKIAEIVVNHHPRRLGKSKYGIGRIWRVVLDIITVKLITGSASHPALWFGLPSFPISILGFSTLLIAAGAYAGGSIQAWTVMSTLAFLFFALGAHLLTVGIIGELSMKTGDFRPHEALRPTIIIL